MALYVYRIADGSLYSWAPDDTDPVAPDDVLAANGFALVSGLPPLDATHGWDAATKTVVAIVPPLPVVSVGTPKWVLRFTSAEMIAIRASSNPDVQHLLFALGFSQSVNMNDPIIIAGVNLLVAAGLLAQDRVAAILAVS